MKIRVNGKEVSLAELEQEVLRVASEAGYASVEQELRSRLDGLWCEEHDSVAEVEIEPGASIADAGRLRFNTCCDRFRSVVDAALEGFVDSSAGPDGDETGLRAEASATESAAAIASDSEGLASEPVDDTPASHGTSVAVYLCYGTEDKVRIALPLGKALRESGVDVWVKDVELLPGDRQIEQRFGAIERASVFVPVISATSVGEAWVREELTAALISRIEGTMKIVPVLADASELPLALRDTVAVGIADDFGVVAAAAEIARKIFDRVERTPLGPPPSYATSIVYRIPNQTPVDSLVLRLLAELATKEGERRDLRVSDVLESAAEQGADDEAVYESVGILENAGYLTEEGSCCSAREHMRVKLSDRGLEEHFKATIADLPALVQRVAAEIVNEIGVGRSRKEGNTVNLAARVGYPVIVVDHIVRTFGRRGWLTKDYSMRGLDYMDASPALKRFASS